MQPNSRYSLAAFVTGGMDLYPDPEQFGKMLASLELPTLVVLGKDYPKRSLATLKSAIAAAQEGSGSKVEVAEVPGKLGLHEEYPNEVYAVAAKFLGVA